MRTPISWVRCPTDRGRLYVSASKVLKPLGFGSKPYDIAATAINGHGFEFMLK
jgi:hypothetical protein